MGGPLDTVKTLARQLGLSDERLEALVGPRLGSGDPLDLEGLTLAAACAEQLPRALEVLDDEVLPQVRATLLRRASAAIADDVLQQTRVKLLLSSPPALTQYAGRGPLVGYVRTVAARALSNLESSQKDHESDDALAAIPATAELEAGLIREDQQAHFKAAFREAVAQLSSRQRSLLRLSLLDALSIDELAPVYGVGRSTVARWLAEARDSLADATRDALEARLGLDKEALESLLRSVQHRFDLSLRSALKDSQSSAADPVE
jgi:RNA polymerase sigma-70 factor (ECF subfamily)